MNEYEELFNKVNELGAQGKFVFIVDAVHEITDDELRQKVNGCQFQLFHFTTIEDTFQWLTRLIDQCTDDAKSKMAIVLYHLEQLVSIPVLINAQQVTTIMRKIMTPNGAISEQKLSIMAKRMLANVLSQAEAAGVTVEHIFDYKEIPNG